MSDTGIIDPHAGASKSGPDLAEAAGAIQDALGSNAAEFAKSELFSRMFQEGMSLVEETASYLDGPGRDESRALSRNAALAYAGESMRLTTRLMQVASWLLVQRALREGEMQPAEAAAEKYRITVREATPAPADRYAAELPPVLMSLIGRAERLFERVTDMDAKLYRAAPSSRGPSGISRQLSQLQAAFGSAEA